jgi:hypothetical protein
VPHVPEAPPGIRYELEPSSETVRAVGRSERLDIYRTAAKARCEPRDPKPYRNMAEQVQPSL